MEEYRDDQYVFMATANGTVKKTELSAFARRRSVGLRALELEEGDRLIGTAITDGDCDVMLFCSSGKVTRFNENDVRAMGRTAKGVRGMRVPECEELISLIIPAEDKTILTVCAKGYGKRTSLNEFPNYKRGGQGVIAIQTSERNGNLVGAVQVDANHEIMLISDQGTLVRTRVDGIPTLGRNTQGVRLIRVRDDETLVGVADIQEEEVDVIDAGVEDDADITSPSSGSGTDAGSSDE